MSEDSDVVLEYPTISGAFSDGSFTGATEFQGPPPGVLMGFDPQNYFWDVQPITPSVAERRPPSVAHGKRIVYINGINTSMADHAYTVKILSVVSGAGVIGIYNQSGDGTDTNIVFDLVQCLGDKTGLNNNPATRTLAQAVYDACVCGEYLNIVAHSQGAIITSRGIRQAIGKLLDYHGRRNYQIRPLIDAFDKRRGGRGRIGEDEPLKQGLKQHILPTVEKDLRCYVSVQTLGGAARFFPDGPRYRHVYNSWDPVPRLFGQGSIIRGPGSGAVLEKIKRNAGSRFPGVADHLMNELYLKSSQDYVDRTGRKVDNNYIPIDMSMVQTK